MGHHTPAMNLTAYIWEAWVYLHQIFCDGFRILTTYFPFESRHFSLSQFVGPVVEFGEIRHISPIQFKSSILALDRSLKTIEKYLHFLGEQVVNQRINYLGLHNRFKRSDCGLRWSFIVYVIDCDFWPHL